jgi:hypothetical protein
MNMQTIPDRTNKPIEMSPAGKKKWQSMLTTRRINTAKQLLSRVRDLKGEPVARRVLNAQSLDRGTWESVFAGLKVHRDDFFTDVEWFDRDLTTQWQMLWDLAIDGNDKFGIILANNGQTTEWKFVESIVSRSSVILEIPRGMSGYLIVVEKDAQDNLILLSPSPLMSNTQLTGAIQRIPQYPPSPFEYLQPITIGMNNIWAGVFPSLPSFPWLADAKARPLRLKLSQLTDLFEYTKKQSKGTQMFRSSYLVTEI